MDMVKQRAVDYNQLLRSVQLKGACAFTEPLTYESVNLRWDSDGRTLRCDHCNIVYDIIGKCDSCGAVKKRISSGGKEVCPIDGCNR